MFIHRDQGRERGNSCEGRKDMFIYRIGIEVFGGGGGGGG